jgi:predicted site-specific integrase-resolvase
MKQDTTHYMSRNEVCDRLQISRSTLLRMERAGVVKFNAARRIRADDLDRMLEGVPCPSPPS